MEAHQTCPTSPVSRHWSNFSGGPQQLRILRRRGHSDDAADADAVRRYVTAHTISSSLGSRTFGLAGLWFGHWVGGSAPLEFWNAVRSSLEEGI